MYPAGYDNVIMLRDVMGLLLVVHICMSLGDSLYEIGFQPWSLDA